MISFKLLCALGVAALLMCCLIAIQMKWYREKAWKSIVVSLSIIITGLIGSRLWFLMENAEWGGLSFFGAVYFAPITFLLVARILRMPYVYSLDYCAVAGCLALGILKVECLISGCCRGIALYQKENGDAVRFPSQIIEFVVALILVVVLLFLSRKEKNRGKIYPLTLVLYGLTRFVLNLFRDDWDRTKELGLLIPLGNIWALVAIVAGVLWLWHPWRKIDRTKKTSNGED